MSAITDALKAIITNPDDLSQLPQIIAQVDQVEAREADYQIRITRLQESNYAYLQQIPLAGTDPKKPEEPEAPPTLADATAAIINSLTGGNN